MPFQVTPACRQSATLRAISHDYLATLLCQGGSTRHQETSSPGYDTGYMIGCWLEYMCPLTMLTGGA